MTPFTITRSSEKKRTTFTILNIRAKRTIRSIFRPDKLTLAAYNSTSNNSSRSPLATRTESTKFQCMEGLDQDQKCRPSTVARSISSTVKRRLKIEFRMRKVNGSGEPICSTVQWASTPIMTAQTRISIAQPSSNFGCATTILANRWHLCPVAASSCRFFISRRSLTPLTLSLSSLNFASSSMPPHASSLSCWDGRREGVLPLLLVERENAS
mmetsp:Transcript_83011/g.199192  ORF Transcript_83011/g.199192 Transcript_83011/m.199192 type:complete len:212 (-) Transcript_83011:453-1088(-)